MNNTSLQYRVEAHDLAGHRLKVTLTIAQPAPEGQQVSLPAWIPGSYLIRDFSRQIETFTAFTGERRLKVSKVDNHTWQIAPCAAPLTLQYVVYAWDLSVRGAHVDQTHAFFNGTSVFMRVHGQEQSPCSVELVHPRGVTGWQVYTSLPMAASGNRQARRDGFGLYEAADYDALIDHPVEMGTGQAVRFIAHGAPHEMVFTDASPDIDLARIAADVKRICEAQIAFFEPRTKRAPFLDSADRYVFMTQVTANGYGGLEHRSSTALMAARKDLPVKGQADAGEGYQTFLGLVSHEYFHTWHVKRIKPQAFVPYDLTRPNLTRLLWVFEGFTSYYDDLFLLRSGVIDTPAYLRLLAKTITQVHATPGRLKQSVAESSYDAWTRYYKQDENSPNALVSYYTKGSLIALGLDLLIREQSAGKKSLDDVMLLLWKRYGRDFYRGGSTGNHCSGVPEESMQALIAEATGVNVQRFLRDHVDGCTDVPLQTLLPTAGLELTWKASSQNMLGARLRKSADGVTIAAVIEGSIAHQAGLSAGDVVVAIDGVRVDGQAAMEATIARSPMGSTLVLHVFRNDLLRVFNVRLRASASQEAQIQPAA